MNKPFLWTLVATVSLAGCGGGGGGGGGSDSPGATTGISPQDLVGGWVRTETTYDTNAQGERTLWEATYRDTVAITRQGSGLNLRDCVTDAIESATYSNKELNLGGTTFTVVDKNTMTFSSNAAEIVYRRMQDSDHAAVGQFKVGLPLPAPYSSVTVTEGQWNELCASSQQFASGVPVVEFKGEATVPTVGNVILKIRFEGYDDFAVGTYSFETFNMDLGVSAEFDSMLGSEELYDPTAGSIEISTASGRLRFGLQDLEMPSSQGDVVLTGPLSLPAAWLATPELD